MLRRLTSVCTRRALIRGDGDGEGVARGFGGQVAGLGGVCMLFGRRGVYFAGANAICSAICASVRGGCVGRVSL